MIDLNNIIQNMPTGIDASIIQSNEESSHLSDDQVDLNDGSQEIDPGSFVLLLANILSHISVEKTPDNEGASVSVEPDEADNKNIDEISQVTSDAASTSETAENQALAMENNAALAWIDSDHFQPPEAESRSKVETNLTGNPLQQNKVVAELSNTELSVKNTSQTLNPGTVSQELDFSESNTDDEFSAELELSEGLNKELSNKLYEQLKKITIENAVGLPKDEKKENDNRPKADEMANIQSTKVLHQQGNIPAQQARQAPESPMVKTLDIPVDIRNSQWADKFSEQIVWLGNQGIKSAVIKITPEDLGPLEISIKVVKDSASVNIVSHSSHVREVIDQALPRLREMMADQGLNLSDVHVGSGDNSQGFNQQNNERQNELFQSSDEEIQMSPLNKKPPKGLIDFFA